MQLLITRIHIKLQNNTMNCWSVVEEWVLRCCTSKQQRHSVKQYTNTSASHAFEYWLEHGGKVSIQRYTLITVTHTCLICS